MRSSNLPASIIATATPDIFKSRRPSHLILMQDDKNRLGKKMGKSPMVNETKPYAGEGDDQNDRADCKNKGSQKDREDQMAKENGLMDDDTWMTIPLILVYLP